MTLKNKIIAGLTALGIAGAVTINALDEACVFDAERVDIGDLKMCFKAQEDYKTYKITVLNKYKPNGNNLWMWIDGEREEFFAVMNKEIVKKKYKSTDLKDIIQELKK